MYEVTVVHGAGKGKVMWSGPEIIVMEAVVKYKFTVNLLRLLYGFCQFVRHLKLVYTVNHKRLTFILL